MVNYLINWKGLRLLGIKVNKGVTFCCLFFVFLPQCHTLNGVFPAESTYMRQLNLVRARINNKCGKIGFGDMF